MPGDVRQAVGVHANDRVAPRRVGQRPAPIRQHAPRQVDSEDAQSPVPDPDPDAAASIERESAPRGPIGGSSATLLELPDGRFASLSEDDVIVSDDRGVTWTVTGPALPMDPAGLAYSAARDSFYVWKGYCDATQQTNPVIAGSILRWDVARTG